MVVRAVKEEGIPVLARCRGCDVELFAIERIGGAGDWTGGSQRQVFKYRQIARSDCGGGFLFEGRGVNRGSRPNRKEYPGA